MTLSGCSAGGAGTEVQGVQYEAGSTTTVAVTDSDGDGGDSARAATAAPSSSPSTVAAAPSPAKPARNDAGVTTTSVASTASSAVAGTFLVGGLGIGGVRVVVIDGSGASRSTTTDLLGRFRIADVAPGTYRLELHDPGDDTPLCDLAGTCVTTRPLHVEARTVEVAPGRDTIATISL